MPINETRVKNKKIKALPSRGINGPRPTYANKFDEYKISVKTKINLNISILLIL